ncbi:chromophore lyase CpcT/CpeT [Gloeobacter kilaueensis]|uniref:Chromophore lyase CpcT/CpeT n=1 Tax=Gloeobacter kilaueensis (strain ATCC BAA-2537 / CCAP 1431/1 / ULC 316 / JS1) TaxID=1183438 RepID=U5QC68_GLOK1|nr:chromophore lyase CpcT/CpeT [Gloeobacter kilaueensis]AGY56502.1 hypothetical protein GKIL_0255 [Gloeobacter kilaueensis JS1]
MQVARALVPVLAGLLAGGAVSAAPVPVAGQVKEVAERLTGIMATTQQSLADPKRPDVRMTTCGVSLSGAAPSAIYLYQEQAMSKELGDPYRQRLLRIAPSPDGQAVESAGFKLVDQKAFSGFCNKPPAERLVPQAALDTAPTCVVLIQPEGENYRGKTPGDGCPTRVRGAERITNEIVLYKDGMDTQDRGFDAQGHQVWGAKEQPYQFRRLTP